MARSARGLKCDFERLDNNKRWTNVVDLFIVLRFAFLRREFMRRKKVFFFFFFDFCIIVIDRRNCKNDGFEELTFKRRVEKEGKMRRGLLFGSLIFRLFHAY